MGDSGPLSKRQRALESSSSRETRRRSIRILAAMSKLSRLSSRKIWNRVKSKPAWARHGFHHRISAISSLELLDVPRDSVKIGFASHRDLDGRTRLQRKARREQHHDRTAPPAFGRPN